MAALSSFERAGPSWGLIQHLMRIYRIYIAERIRPGIMAPAKSFPTDRAAWSAMTTNIILGGMRIPSVPPAHMLPQASLLL